MLYQFHEMQRAMLRPLSAWAEATAQIYSNPVLPFSHTPMAKRMSAGLQLLHRIGKTYEKPDWNLETTEVDGQTIEVTTETAIDLPFCKLTHFRRAISDERNAQDPRVLLVAPLSGHFATLLRDTARMLIRDHDVWVTEWVDAKFIPVTEGPWCLDDYVHYVIEFIRALGPSIHLISVCQPTVPVLAAVSLMASANDPKSPRSMTMMGGPIDTRRGSTAVNDLAKRKPLSWFENHVIYSVPAQHPGYLRKVYPGFLQHAGFVAMNPDRHTQAHYDYYLDLVKGDLDDAESHRKFYDEYNAVLDMPAEYYLQTIRTVFQDHLLPRGLWEVRGQLVKPADIKTTALLTVEGELDDISGPGQTQAAHDLCTGIPADRQQDVVVEGAGHYGIFSGRRWREVVYPKIREFIREHN
ncbi:polyhydroxyalkanoate depolymerase [Derxia gummosa]|uniref:Polyhydroxyalkanoate depolymerase n=1 Tax=Derxia gummosa DSM 723 TaxID=1121388 RepID=A0A8B6X5X4_9BURK|nr:polyhydroxyalkanoate depolymerase [Derxia gummosa]